MSTIELYAVLVEYAEDGAATAETTDSPDVVDSMTTVYIETMVLSRSCFVSAAFVL